MKPTEPIEILNQRLIDYFGTFENGEPNWKLVWSEDFFEKRLVYYTAEGFELLTPIAETRKKCDYIVDRYILTRLVPVPDVQQMDLCGAKISYEPIWTFEDETGFPLPPTWAAMHVLIQTIDQSLGHSPFAKYKQEEIDGNSIDAIKARRDIIQEQLFGNENPITDSLALDSAVGYGTRKRSDWTH